MKSTSPSRASTLTAALFDDQVVRLAQSRKAAGTQAYFSLAPRAGATTYYQQPSTSATPEHFEFPGDGTAAGLIDALAAYWMAEGEKELAALAPKLKKIAEALKSERAAGNGSVDILCYTMF